MEAHISFCSPFCNCMISFENVFCWSTYKSLCVAFLRNWIKITTETPRFRHHVLETNRYFLRLLFIFLLKPPSSTRCGKSYVILCNVVYSARNNIIEIGTIIPHIEDVFNSCACFFFHNSPFTKQKKYTMICFLLIVSWSTVDSIFFGSLHYIDWTMFFLFTIQIKYRQKNDMNTFWLIDCVMWNFTSMCLERLWRTSDFVDVMNGIQSIPSKYFNWIRQLRLSDVRLLQSLQRQNVNVNINC